MAGGRRSAGGGRAEDSVARGKGALSAEGGKSFDDPDTPEPFVELAGNEGEFEKPGMEEAQGILDDGVGKDVIPFISETLEVVPGHAAVSDLFGRDQGGITLASGGGEQAEEAGSESVAMHDDQKPSEFLEPGQGVRLAENDPPEEKNAQKQACPSRHGHVQDEEFTCLGAGQP